MLRGFANGRLFGRTWGTGLAQVLALHGWGRSGRDFEAVFAPADGPVLDAVALDLPGFGATPPPPEPWGTADFAACVADVLDELRSPVVVLGHSFGGRVAVRLAASRPDSVAGLVLTGTPLPLLPRPTSRPRAGYRLARRLHRAGLVSDRRMEAARQRHGSVDYRRAEGVMRQVLVTTVNETYREPLAGVTCPVAMVWGDDDTEAPLVEAEAAAEAMTHCTLTVCSGVGHLTPLTAPEAIRRALDELLGGCS